MDDNVVTLLLEENRLLRQNLPRRSTEQAEDLCINDIVVLEGKQYVRIGEAKNPGPVLASADEDEDDDDPP